MDEIFGVTNSYLSIIGVLAFLSNDQGGNGATLTRLLKHDHAYDSLSARFLRQFHRFVVQKLKSRNDKNDPSATKLTSMDIEAHWSLMSSVGEMDRLFKRCTFTTAETNENHEPHPPGNFVSDEQLEALIRSLESFNNLFAAGVELDSSSSGARSSGLHLLNNVRENGPSIEQNMELPNLRHVASKSSAHSAKPKNPRQSDLAGSEVGVTSLRSAHPSSSLAAGYMSIASLNHPHSSIQSWSLGCGGQLEEETETADRAELIQRLEAELSTIAEGGPKLSLNSRKSWFNIKPCYIIIALAILSISISLAAALWRSEAMNDFSGGFTLAQYIFAVGISVAGIVTALHVNKCKCWRS